jgi:hypothetical protein
MEEDVVWSKVGEGAPCQSYEQTSNVHIQFFKHRAGYDILFFVRHLFLIAPAGAFDLPVQSKRICPESCFIFDHLSVLYARTLYLS